MIVCGKIIYYLLLLFFFKSETQEITNNIKNYMC